MSARLTFPAGTWKNLTAPQRSALLKMSAAKGPAVFGGHPAISAAALARQGLLEHVGYAKNGLESIFLITDAGKEVAAFGRADSRQKP